MKIIAVILLAVGIGLGALGAYGFFFSADNESCRRSLSQAEAALNEAHAAQGTPREADLMKEVRIENDIAAVNCRNAARTRQQAMLVALGGLAAVVVSVVLLIVSRNRTA